MLVAMLLPLLLFTLTVLMCVDAFDIITGIGVVTVYVVVVINGIVYITDGVDAATAYVMSLFVMYMLMLVFVCVLLLVVSSVLLVF